MRASCGEHVEYAIQHLHVVGPRHANPNPRRETRLDKPLLIVAEPTKLHKTPSLKEA
jgi:hypothetical protein